MNSHLTPSARLDPFNNLSTKYKPPGPLKDPFNPISRGSSFTTASAHSRSTRSSRSRSRAASSRTASSRTTSCSSPSPERRNSRSKSRDSRGRKQMNKIVYDNDEDDECTSHFCPHHSTRKRSRSRARKLYFLPSPETLSPHEEYHGYSPYGSYRAKGMKNSPPPPYTRSSSRARDSYFPPQPNYPRSAKRNASRSYLEGDGYDETSDEEDYDDDYYHSATRKRKGRFQPQRKESTGNRIASFLASLCNLD